MKKRLLICILTTGCSFIYAQENATLTKKETISYINKKLRETHNLLFNNDFEIIYKNNPDIQSRRVSEMYILDTSIGLNEDSDTVTYIERTASSLSPCEKENLYYGSIKREVHFNPIHITNVEILDREDLR